MPPLAYAKNWGRRRFGDHGETADAAVKITIIETSQRLCLGV
jgi:hypothetical protein